MFKLGVFLNGPIEVQFALIKLVSDCQSGHTLPTQLPAMLCRELSISDARFFFHIQKWKLASYLMKLSSELAEKYECLQDYTQ